MKLLFEATLEDKNFSEIADEILLTDIVEEPVSMDSQAELLAIRGGSMRTVHRRNSLTVRLRYAIRTQDIARRAEIRDLAAAWACGGGTLKTNTRPGKMLHVFCDDPPSLKSSNQWTDVLEISLTAYAVPYWLEDTATSLNVTTALNESSGLYEYANVLTPPGNAGTAPVEMTIVFLGEAFNWLKIYCAGTVIELNNIGLGSFETMQITYDKNGVLQMYKSTVDGVISLLPNRTAESDDDLLAALGKGNQIHIYSDVAISGCKIQCWGRWL